LDPQAATIATEVSRIRDFILTAYSLA
jgi:hypothetical protein